MTSILVQISELVESLLRPYALLVALTWLGLAHLWRRRRESRGRLLLAAGPFAALTLLSLPAVAHLALGSLEWPYPPTSRRPEGAAVVVPSAGFVPRDAVRLHDELSDATLGRCLEAVRAYRAGPPCPVVVSGGEVDPENP